MLIAVGGAYASTLYAPVYGTIPDEVNAYSSASDGSLTPLAGSPFAIGPAIGGGVIAFAFTPDGNRAATGFLFDAGGVRGLTVGAAGDLTPAQATIPVAQATSVAISPDGRFAYFSTRTGASGVRAYSIDATGALTEIAGSPFAAGIQHWDVALTPSGSFLYAVGSDEVRRFRVNGDGSLSVLGNLPLADALLTQVSSDGKFLFVGTAGAGADSVVSYSIGADGSLTAVGSPFLYGGTSLGMFGIAPDGRHLYLPDANLDAVLTTAVAPDGSLSLVGAPAPFADAVTVVVSPDGRFVYAGKTSGTGALSLSPIAADGRPSGFVPTAVWDSIEFERLVFRPAQAPTARFTAKAAGPGLATKLDATASSAATGAIARYSWDFADGTATDDTSGATPSHKFKKAGVYDVKLTVYDDQNCSSQFVYTGQSTVCNGGPSATTTLRVDTPPVISSVKLKPKRFRVGAGSGTVSRVSYRLSERANVTFSIQRPTIGRKVGDSCRKASRRLRGKPRCTRWVKVGRTLKQRGKSGRNYYRFKGRAGRNMLRPGRYRMRIVATDPAGGRSRSRTAVFHVVR